MARPRIKKRKYEGQQEAERLARWLNEAPNAADRERIKRLIYDIRDFLTMTQSAHANHLLGPGGWFRQPHAVEDIQDLAREIEGRLPQYWNATRLELWSPSKDPAGLTFQIRWRQGSEIAQEEVNAFLDVLKLTREGNIYRLRDCDICPRWMFVKFPHGDRSEKQCSKPCKREARKHYMREKMKAYRLAEKERDERAKAAVKYRRK